MLNLQKEKIFKIISIIINLSIVIMETVAFFMSWNRNDLSVFQFYTEDSNLFALIACLILAVCQIKSLNNTGYKVPVWVKTIKYMAVCCLTVTFLVVIGVLAPSKGGSDGYVILLFTDSMLYSHFLCPVLSIISFVFFERQPMLEKKSALIALIPTIVYALIAIILNIMKVIEGPYDFLKVYTQPVWMSVVWAVAMWGGAFLINLLIWKLNKGRVKAKSFVKIS